MPNSENFILSRDYLGAKLWDIRKGANPSASMIVNSPSTVKPIYSAHVTDYLERNLANLLETDSLEDQFSLAISPNGQHFATGGYNKSGHVIDLAATTNTSIACKFNVKKGTAAGSLKVYGKNKRLIVGNSGNHSSALDSQLNLRKKVT